VCGGTNDKTWFFLTPVMFLRITQTVTTHPHQPITHLNRTRTNRWHWRTGLGRIFSPTINQFLLFFGPPLTEPDRCPALDLMNRRNWIKCHEVQLQHLLQIMVNQPLTHPKIEHFLNTNNQQESWRKAYHYQHVLEIFSLLQQVTYFIALDLVWEFGGEGKGRLWRVGNMGGNGKIFHIFLKCNFLENDKLMFMINIFLILKILHRLNLKNSCKPSKTLIQYNFLVPKMRRICIMKKNEPPKSSSLNVISSTCSFIFFKTPPLLFPPNSQTKP